jgi:hypothetical protein
MNRHRERLRWSVRNAALPYGYTVVTWTSGGVLIATHGAPDLLNAYLFLAGACGAFALVAWFARGGGDHPDPAQRPGPVTSAIAASAALGCAGAVANTLPGRPAYMLVSLLGTLVYFVVRAI